MATTSYAIALGSNRRHGRHGTPARVIAAAADALSGQGIDVKAMSAVRGTAALGPAGRSFANGVAIISTRLEPPALLAMLKKIERDFGRRSGRRWGPRVLDLDILLWSEGAFAADGLVVPHPAFRERRFVLDPLTEIVPCWRDPISGLTMRHLRRRLAAPRPVDPAFARS